MNQRCHWLVAVPLCIIFVCSASPVFAKDTQEKWLVYEQQPGNYLFLGTASFDIKTSFSDKFKTIEPQLNVLKKKQAECTALKERFKSKPSNPKNDWDAINCDTAKILWGENYRNPDPKTITNFVPYIDTINEKDLTFVLVVIHENKNDSRACHKVVTPFQGVDGRIVPPIPDSGHIEKKAAGFAQALQGNPPNPNEIQESVTPKLYLCDLGTVDIGAQTISYTIGESVALDATGKPTFTKINLQGSINVHALYRFRITAGPVFSSLIKKNKSFTLKTNSGGDRVIASDNDNESPVNYPIFLKAYWAPRDFLVDPGWDTWEGWATRFNPTIGVNLFDKPLENFYAGLSFEPILGVDIVGGAHFSKVSRLAEGFYEGQVVPTGDIATKEKFLTGWYIGGTVDIGVLASWLANRFIGTIRSAWGP